MILQNHLPLKHWMEERTRRLPGLSPITIANWLVRDETYGQQMALRDQLINERRTSVYQARESSIPAAQELLSVLTDELQLQPGYALKNNVMVRPDGGAVMLADETPLVIAGRLVQEDLLILQQDAGQGGYHLTAGLLCFPASWHLSQKIGRPLTDIHEPVASYTHDIANRVNRIFDGLRTDQPLMRANYLIYTDPSLHQPRREGEEKPISPDGPRFVRVERQTLRRLAKTQAVIFAIHTYVVKAEQLTQEERASLARVRPALLR